MDDRSMLSATKRLLLFGFLYSLVGLSVGYYITAVSSGYRFFQLSAGSAAFMTAGFLWWVIVERKNRHSLRNAIIVGVLSGILSHWVCWYLYIMAPYFIELITGSSPTALGEISTHLLNGVLMAFSLSLFSLLIYGVITVFAGIFIGGLYSLWIGTTSNKNFHTDSLYRR